MTSEAERLEALAGSVARERARVDETVKEIQHKLTPGQLIDEVMRQGGEPARNALVGLGKTVAAHPLPMLLMGAALLWLALESRDAQDTSSQGSSPVS
jgi:hypothetical protein